MQHESMTADKKENRKNLDTWHPKREMIFESDIPTLTLAEPEAGIRKQRLVLNIERGQAKTPNPRSYFIYLRSVALRHIGATVAHAAAAGATAA
jgi:hypothetical protein